MEVHAHTHTERKKWFHYLWEFLMLFLAVFCGFLAENFREHKIEKDREKQYIRSFVEDLGADINSLGERINYCTFTQKLADSTIGLLTRKDRDTVAKDIYHFLRQLHRSDLFTVNDRTIIQLRNAGGMRMISDKAVSDSMMDYYKQVDFIRFIFEESTEFRHSLRTYFPMLLDGVEYRKFENEEFRDMPVKGQVKLLSADPEVINTILITLNHIDGINEVINHLLNNLRKKARGIREFILKKYNLS